MIRLLKLDIFIEQVLIVLVFLFKFSLKCFLQRLLSNFNKMNK